MTIKEMQEKGYIRYTAFISKTIFTNEVEVWAKDYDEGRNILDGIISDLPDFAFENKEMPEIFGLEHSGKSPSSYATAQPIITKYNENFYKGN